MLNIPKTKKGPKPAFNYSNFNYDILAYVVYKLEKIYIDKYLERTILKNVDYFWYKRSGKPIASYGLTIHTSTFKIFASNLLDILHTTNLRFFWNTKRSIKIGSKKYYLTGSDGSGGQYLYYNLKLNSILCWFSYGQGGENRTFEKYKDMYIKYSTVKK